MSAIVHENYRGRMPRKNPRNLPANAAQVAQNVSLGNGTLRPFGGFLVEANLFHGVDAQTIYLYRDSSTKYWFNWDAAVDVVPGPFAGDLNNRRYYSGAPDNDGSGKSRPKKTGSDIGTGSEGTELPADWYWIGVQDPPKAPAVSEQAAGSGETLLRAYVYTHVTGDGEESGPSAPVEITTQNGSTIRVDFFPDVVASGADAGTDAINFAAAHNLPDYAKVQISANAPAGASTGVDYYVIPVDDDSIKLATSLANALAGTAVDLTGSNTPTIELHGLDPRYNVTARRIYRTVSGLQGETEYHFVAEVTGLATQTHDESETEETVGRAEILPTDVDLSGNKTDYATFAEPPEDLTGLTTVPGGFLAGFSPSQRQVCFSHPFHPYAWPVRYRYALDFDPVSIKAVGSGVQVGTGGRPYLFQGQHPARMSRQMLMAQQGCVAARGAVEWPGAALYPSQDGLFAGGPGIERIITEALFSKPEWTALRPSSFIAAVYDQRYFFCFDTDGAGNNQVGILNPADIDEAFVTVNANAKALFSDLEDDALFMLIDGQVKQFDADPTTPLVYTWRGKRDRLASPENMACVQLKADFTLSGTIGGEGSFAEYNALRAEIAAANDALIDEELDEMMGMEALGLGVLGLDGYLDEPPALGDGVIVRVYGGKQLRAEITVGDSNPRRLPGGYKADEYEIELEGQITVEQDRMATSIRELNQVP